MASAVNINWLFGASCRFCRSGYAATKGGLVSMARSIAADLAPRNIRVNVVAPGAIKTPIWKRGPRASASAEDSAKLAKFFSSAVPQGRWGEPEEVAKAVLFLASDDSSYINAVELMVDGGLTGAPLGAPIFQDGFRPLGSEAKLAKAHAEGDTQ